MRREDLELLVCLSASNQTKYERNYLIFKVLKKKKSRHEEELFRVMGARAYCLNVWLQRP